MLTLGLPLGGLPLELILLHRGLVSAVGRCTLVLLVLVVFPQLFCQRGFLLRGV